MEDLNLDSKPLLETNEQADPVLDILAENRRRCYTKSLATNISLGLFFLSMFFGHGYYHLYRDTIVYHDVSFYVVIASTFGLYYHLRTRAHKFIWICLLSLLPGAAIGFLSGVVCCFSPLNERLILLMTIMWSARLFTQAYVIWMREEKKEQPVGGVPTLWKQLAPESVQSNVKKFINSTILGDMNSIGKMYHNMRNKLKAYRTKQQQSHDHEDLSEESTNESEDLKKQK